jgi:hypothetical protein
MSGTLRTITVGPFPIYFGNVNDAMGLPGHYHTGAVTLVYGYHDGDHGYPSFQETNDELRARLKDLTARIFRDATNEVVADRLWQAFRTWTAPSWPKWGGAYWLHELHLDVEGVHDKIGHDASVTRYSIVAQGDAPMLPGAAEEEAA